jgi:hypothetical protein
MPAPKRTPRFDEITNLLKVPFRVQGAGGLGGGGGEDLEAWMDGIVEAVFPHLPHRADAAQFRESLAELTAASMRQSPYAGGAVPFTAGPAPMPGASGWSPIAWSSNGAPAYGSSATQAGASMAPTSLGSWTPGPSANGTGAGAPLGMADLTGPFATLASIANALEQNALPAAREIGPLTQEADLDLIEAERAVVVDILTSLIAELRQPAPDGPEEPVAVSLTTRLGNHVDLLGEAVEVLDTTQTPPVTGADAVTPADFANVSRFQVLQGWATAINATLAAAFSFAGVDKRAIVALVKQLLGVIAEKARELELELDFADFGPQERARFEVATTPPGGGEISVARLLEWLQDQAGRQLPRLLDTSGTLAKDTVVTILGEQQLFVATLAGLSGPADFPWTYPIVDRLVDDLARYLQDAITEASNL